MPDRAEPMPYEDPSTAPRPGSARLAMSRALVAIVAIFGALRASALFNDLWLDELWSLWHVSQLRSVGGIFSRFLHDNNHPLNSLWMHLTLPLQADWIFRVPSWLGGTAAIWLAGKIAGLQIRRLHSEVSEATGRAAELITAVLFGSSYLFTVYSSEARGYGPALGFGLLGMYALLRGPAAGRSVWTPVYWVAAVLGMLSHAIVFQLLAGGLAFTLVRSIEERLNARNLLLAIVRWHGLPLLCGTIYYITFLRRMEIVGGPETPLISVLGNLAAFSLGFPTSTGTMLAAPLLLIAISAALVIFSKRSAALTCFHVVSTIGFPAAAILLTPFIFYFPRYFILSAAGAMLLVGYLAALAWNSGHLGRGISLAVTLLIVTGNLVHASGLLRHGRGGYTSAFRYMAAQTPTGEITVGSDHDGRNALLVHHHGLRTVQPKSLRYISRPEMPAEGVQWLLVHRLDDAPFPPVEVIDDRGNPYRLEQVFPHAPLSGWDWYLYRSRRLMAP